MKYSYVGYICSKFVFSSYNMTTCLVFETRFNISYLSTFIQDAYSVTELVLKKPFHSVSHCLFQAFACPTELYARALVATEAPVYRYEFTFYEGSDWYRAGHGTDIPYVFGLPLFPSSRASDEKKHVSKEMVRYWTNFVQTG